jgi:hypothetical protein
VCGGVGMLIGCIEECVGSYVVACSFKSVIANVEWVFAGVYWPKDDVERRNLWAELAGLMSIWEMPWCGGGGWRGGGGGGRILMLYGIQVKE